VLEIASGSLSLRHVAIEDFELQPDEPPNDIALAIRVVCWMAVIPARKGRHIVGSPQH
jgi:hypothetical protein